MKTPIVKSRGQAIKLAKDNCKSQSGKERGQYIIHESSARCDCGETPAVEIIMFTGRNHQNQSTSRVGYCKFCGENRL